MPTLSKNPISSAWLLADSAEAERRLPEAEDWLREAIQELQRHHRMAASGDDTPYDHADDPAWPTPLVISAKAFSSVMALE